MHKYHKMILIFIVVILFTFTGCQKETEMTTIDDESTEEVTTLEESTEEDETEEETVDNMDEEDYALLHPIVNHYTADAQGDDGDVYIREEGTHFVLNKEEADRYPELAAALAKAQEQMMLGIVEHLESSYGQAKEFHDVNTDPDILFYLGKAYGDVVRADEQVVSILKRSYGLARNDFSHFLYLGDNYDTKTGEKLSIDDIVTDYEQFLKLFDERVIAANEENLVDMDIHKDTMIDAVNIPEMITFTIGHDGIVVYYNFFSMEPEEMESLVFHFKVEDSPGLFNAELFDVPKDYVEPLPPFAETDIDLDDDGKAEKVCLHYVPDEEDYYENFSLIIDGEEMLFDEDALENQTFRVHKNGSDYLYVFQTSENGYGTLKIIGFEGKEPHILEVYENIATAPLYMDFHFLNPEETMSSFMLAYMTFSDIDDIILSSKLDGLGTVFGVKQYYVGEDGLLSTDDEYYRVSGNWQDDYAEHEAIRRWVFTLKQDLKMNVLDENLMEGETINVPQGTKVYYIRTDDATYADFRLEDGREVRAEVDVKNHTINGIDIFEALDGVMFAG